ncbi:14184_t:CDS:2, partial [Entrophospora sp. SA101]
SQHLAQLCDKAFDAEDGANRANQEEIFMLGHLWKGFQDNARHQNSETAGPRKISSETDENESITTTSSVPLVHTSNSEDKISEKVESLLEEEVSISQPKDLT